MEAWTPTPGQTWPPKDHGPLWKPLTVWEAWWTGQPDALRAAMTQASQVPANHPSQYRGGIVGAVARTFWGRPLNQADRPSRSDLHLPLAADIARTSADLLYADAPTITSQDKRSQVVIDAMVDTGLIETLTEGAELGAALGGRYHRVTIDPTVDDGRPFITTHGPDEVIPTFTWGRLTAATIVETITDDDTTQIVWRHMEHHYLDPAGYGHIRHDLWKGTHDTLGTLVPLTDRPETAGLQVNADAEWTGPLTPGLAMTGQGDVEVDVEFPNAVSENPLDQSAAVAQVKAAGVMSRAIAVRALHPDWDDAQVNDELAAIAADKRDEASLDDPTTWHPTHDENEDE